MSKITLNETGKRAPGMLTRDYRATYRWQKDGKTYRQIDSPNGRNWIEEGTAPEPEPVVPFELPYQEYEALISQTSGNPTVDAVLQSVDGFNPAFIKGADGYYRIVASGKFPKLKTSFWAGNQTNGGLGGDAHVQMKRVDDNELYLLTTKLTPDFTPRDGVLDATTIVIRFYP